MSRVRWTLPCVVLLWFVAAAATTLPITPVGSLFGLAFGILSWIAIVATVVALGVVGGHRWLTLTTTALTLVLAAVLLNWSSAAPQAWFRAHRALYDHVARTFEPDTSYYGSELPVWLRPLTANGRVRRDESGLFFPQWLGFPDNAGGYFYAPDRAPEGADMLGAICHGPEDLGGGWWVCGMELQ